MTKRLMFSVRITRKLGLGTVADSAYVGTCKGFLRALIERHSL
jgi:hypothetical protein